MKQKSSDSSTSKLQTRRGGGREARNGPLLSRALRALCFRRTPQADDFWMLVP